MKMMTNLFSIFDPSSPPFPPFNWLSLFLPLLLLLPPFWMKNSKIMMTQINLAMIIHNEMKTLTQSNYSKGSSLIFLSVMWFILLNNFMGLFPFIFTATSHLLISMSLALPIWTLIILFGWLTNTNHMFSHLMPLGTPNTLAIFMVCVETISNLIRPVTLSIRLTANMIAGHLILTLLSSSFSLSPHTNILLLTPEILLIILESTVAIIQAYVFMILLSLYSTEIH